MEHNDTDNNSPIVSSEQLKKIQQAVAEAFDDLPKDDDDWNSDAHEREPYPPYRDAENELDR